MRCRSLSRITMIAAVCLLASGRLVPADEAADSAQAEQAIRAAAQQYTEALRRGDAAAMLALWAEGGDIVDEFGNATPAKEIIESEAAARAAASQADPASTIKVVENSLRFITPDVALEDGKVEVTRGGEATSPQAGRFTAIWVKQAGGWRLASLREVRLVSPPTSALEGLDWMVGQWKGQAGPATFEISAHWNDKHTYLIRDLVVTHDGKTLLNGQQRIGIDPLDGKIKSWMHDADGGHGEGVWTHQGDAWVVQATGVSPEGRQTAGTNVYRQDGPNRFLWKSTGATADGQSTPDFEITLERVEKNK